MRTGALRAFSAFPTPLQTHMASEIDTRLVGKSAASDLALFDTITHDDAGPFVRNATFWGADVDLTCISPSNSTGSAGRGGVAITKRHVLYCKHTAFYPADAASIRFVTMADAAVARTQDAHFELVIPDMTIGVLDSDLPATITPCSVAPDSFLKKINFTPTIPVLSLDAEEKGIVKDIDYISASLVYTKTPADSQRLEFHEALVSGDSGDPAFVIINGELVLIGITMDVNLFSCPAGLNSILNAAIVSVDTLNGDLTGYTVTNPDLTEF